MLPQSVLRRFVFVAAVILLPACGVQFNSPSEDSEIFKDLEIEGDLFANRQLILVLEVNQAYSVPVRVACYYEDPDDLSEAEAKVAFQERATLIGERVLPASDAASPGDDVPRETLRFPFSIPAPGSYFVTCITPASPENGIGLDFRLLPAIDAVA